MYFVFSLSFSVFLFLLVCQFLFIFSVASFDGLRPLLVTCLIDWQRLWGLFRTRFTNLRIIISHCSLRSLANELRSFVPIWYNTEPSSALKVWLC